MSDRTISSNNFRDNARIHQGDVIHNFGDHDDRSRCLSDLRVTDPRDDKIRIQESKGGLLKDSYRWILDHGDFRQWRQHGSESCLLWIKGDPGKGKTMLLCGIIDELSKAPGVPDPLAFFFCQATDSRINNATAVLRGLIYMLIKDRESLISYLWKEYKSTGERLFKDVNAFAALSRILAVMLQDEELKGAILIIDALDECVTDLESLLRLIIKLSETGVRLIVSSRNWPEIDMLQLATQKVVLQLELNEASVSGAVRSFIAHKVQELVRHKGIDNQTRNAVHEYLTENSNDTFLWVALVCQLLEDPKVQKRHALSKLKGFPPKLDALYERMMSYILDSPDSDVCKQILGILTTVYRPISIQELESLVKTSWDGEYGLDALKELVQASGSFLMLRDGIVFFIHQSAKDFLLRAHLGDLQSSSVGNLHHDIFRRSLETLATTLKRNIYQLKPPGPLERVVPPDPDPLAPVRYLCVHWASHLRDSGQPQISTELRDGGSVDSFLRAKLLYWLEALCLLQYLPEAIKILHLVGDLVMSHPPPFLICQINANGSRFEVSQNAPISGSIRSLESLIQDALRFIRYFKPAIEEDALQIYALGLILAPQNSLVRHLFQKDAPILETHGSGLLRNWNPRIQRFECRDDTKYRLRPGPDDFIIVSYSNQTMKIHNTVDISFQTLKGRFDHDLVVFTSDGQRLASVSIYGEIKIWDVAKTICLQTLNRTDEHGQPILTTFSNGCKQLVIVFGSAVQIWDLAKGTYSETISLQPPDDSIGYRALAENGTRLALAMEHGGLQIWNPKTGALIGEHHKTYPSLLVFSGDGRNLVVFSSRLYIWDLERELWWYLQENGGRSFPEAGSFSRDGGQLAVLRREGIEIWRMDGTLVTSLSYHTLSRQLSLTFSRDGLRLASLDLDAVHVWDLTMAQAAESVAEENSTDWIFHKTHQVLNLHLSADGQRLAIVFPDCVQFWDAKAGIHLQSLRIPFYQGRLIFSRDVKWVALQDPCIGVKIWNALKGTLVLEVSLRSGLATAVFFSGHGQDLAAIWTTSDSIDLYNLQPDVRTRKIQLSSMSSSEGLRKALLFSQVHEKIVLTRQAGRFEVHDTKTGESLSIDTIRPGSSRVVSKFSLSLVSGGYRLASISELHSLGRAEIDTWDMATGARLQQFDLEIEPILSSSQFTLPCPTGYRFKADHKTLAEHRDLVLDILLTQSELHRSPARGYRPMSDDVYLSRDGRWIMKASKRILWLPHEYVVGKMTLSSQTLVIAPQGGGFIRLQFSES